MKKGARAIGVLLKVVAKASFIVVALALPILGIWFASSLAAFRGGSTGVAIAIGLLAFPVLPLVWEAVARWRRDPEREPILKTSDRLVLRTLLINLLFVGGVLTMSAATLFDALATRGDWMLDGRHDETSESVRGVLFGAADEMAFLHERFHRNEFAEHVDGGSPGPTDSDSRAPSSDADSRTPSSDADDRAPSSDADDRTPSSDSDGDGDDRAPSSDADDREPTSDSDGDGRQPSSDADGREPSSDADGRERSSDSDHRVPSSDADHREPSTDAEPASPPPLRPRWPYPEHPEITVRAVPPNAEGDWRSVAQWLGEHTRTELARAKVIHDYVAVRTAYDVPALADLMHSDQSADAVYRDRKGVCAGYANLFAAMAQEAGLEARVVVGDVRKGGEIAGDGHAWNAVRIDGEWYLVDPTWDAGYVGDETFTARYGTDYLFTPPAIFGRDHLPDDPAWQLRDEPLGRGEFARQPMLRPGFDRHGFELLAPDRAQVEVDGPLTIRVANPAGDFMMATHGRAGSDHRCDVTDGNPITIHCDVPAGRSTVTLFGSTQRYSTYHGIGTVLVVAR
ncbi:MAG: hypothetical protein JJ863_26225 [Deltaproteobacteria bacterium]|nr:hypothetical protein [Deltaproteobacteria bacterium]